MNKVLYILAISALLLLKPFTVLAQPPLDGFMKPKGQTDLALSYTYYTYDKFYAGKDLTNLSGSAHTISAFGIRGIKNWLNLQLSLPYSFVDGQNGVQNLSGYFKASIIQKPWNDGSKFNLIYAPGFSFPFVQYDTESLGANVSYIDQRLIAQYKFSKGFFMMAQSGYTFKFGSDVPSTVPLAFKIGLAARGYYLDLWVDNQFAFSGGDFVEGSEASFRTYKVSYTSIGLTFYETLKGNTGLAIVPSYVLNGRNIAQALSISFSLIYSIPPQGNKKQAK